MAWEPGTRVVVRYRLADGLHDALGDLLEVAADHVTVRTRRGDIRVEASTMVTGKKVPPPVW
ncbi:MAG: putative acetyltransferase [Pauljensenia sp.]